MVSWATTFNDGCLHMTIPGGGGLFLPLFASFLPFPLFGQRGHVGGALRSRPNLFRGGAECGRAAFLFWLVNWPLAKVTRQHIAGLLAGALGSGPCSRVSSSASLCLSLLRPTKQTSAIARALPVECPPLSNDLASLPFSLLPAPGLVIIFLVEPRSFRRTSDTPNAGMDGWCGRGPRCRESHAN